MANFRTPNTTINAPQFTTIPPQIHHKKATFYHPFSPKPPQKHKKLPQKKSLNKNFRVPHLRDGLIVDKVGIRAKHEPLSSPSRKPHRAFTKAFTPKPQRIQSCRNNAPKRPWNNRPSPHRQQNQSVKNSEYKQLMAIKHPLRD
jgi:hypothetical protein